MSSHLVKILGGKSAVLGGCLLFSGCAAYSNPRIAASAFNRYHAPSQQYTVGIERSPLPDFAFVTTDDLISAARKHGLFQRVDYVDNLPTPPALVLRDFSSTSRHMFCEPMLMVLTIGIVPQPCGISHKVSYTVTSPTGIEVCRVQGNRQSTILWGWFSGLIRLLPGWGRTDDKTANADAILFELLDKLAANQYFLPDSGQARLTSR